MDFAKSRQAGFADDCGKRPLSVLIGAWAFDRRPRITFLNRSRVADNSL